MAVRVGWGDEEQHYIYVQFIAHSTQEDLQSMQVSVVELANQSTPTPIVVNFADRRENLFDFLPYFDLVSRSAYNKPNFVIFLGLDMYMRTQLRHFMSDNFNMQYQVGICDTLNEARTLISPDTFHAQV